MTMEITRAVENRQTIQSTNRPSNDNHRKVPSFGRSVFPEDAVARIYRPSRSAMTSGKALTKGWRLVFDRRSAPYIEPLMGWTAGDDTLTQVELSFPTLQAAVRYAERQGLTYHVENDPQSGQASDARRVIDRKQAFSGAMLDRLGLAGCQDSYVRAMAHATKGNAANANEAETYNAAIDVVNDQTLSLEDKRSILMNWAWHEYLIDQATNEGMPENGRPSRLHEVELALLALESAPTSTMASAPAAKPLAA
jgi:hypothetical protein